MDEKLITLKNYAEFLGITSNSLYRIIRKGGKNIAPRYYIGRCIRFKKEEVLAILNKSKQV